MSAARVAGLLYLLVLANSILSEFLLRSPLAVFLGLGSTLFAVLWWKSRYIPRVIAAWGIFASLALFIGILTMMVVPALSSTIGVAYWAPIFIFDISIGSWLLVKGSRAPA